MQRLLGAYSHKDVSAIMAFYSDDPDAIFFEDTIPFQFDKTALRSSLELVFNAAGEKR
jgi:ketosteroid isomerase-like protein